MHPLARTCLAFVVGVALSPWLDLPAPVWALVALVSLGAMWRPSGLPGLVLAGLLGVACCRLVPQGPALEGHVALVGVRTGAASGREAHVDVLRARQVGGSWQASRGRVAVQFSERPPPAGVGVLVFGTARDATTQRLPGAPDPTRAMARVGIRTQVRARRVRVLGPELQRDGPPRDPTGLLTALTLGDRSGLAPHTVEVLRATGTAHLLAISGFHVGVVSMLVAGVARRFRRGLATVRPAGVPPIEWGAAVAAAFTYAMVAGSPLSAQRAAGLLALGAVGRFAGRGLRMESLLGLVAVAVLWLDPAAVATPSFQLSFGAVVGLLRIGAPMQARLPAGRLRWLSSGIAATTGATLGTLPAAAWWFQDLAVWSPLANLVALPLTSLVLVPCAGVAAFGPEPLASLADTVGTAGSRVLVGLLEPMAVEPFHPAVGPVGALVLGVAVLLAHRPALATLLAMFALGVRPVPRQLTITFLAVGQGDATLVEHANGRRWLVDGGPGRVDVTAWLRRRGIRRIDRVVATHNQRDHIGGLGTVLDTLRVGELHVSSHAGLGVVRAAAERQGVPIRPASGIHPAPAFAGEPNDRSVVMAVGPVLLTGDIERAGEAAVARFVGPFDVMKVPHHGSTTSSSDGLLGAVSPTVAVVSVGKGNPWGHPRDVVLARYDRHGIAVLRTDIHGTLQWTEGGWRAHRPGEGWYVPTLHVPPRPPIAPVRPPPETKLTIEHNRSVPDPMREGGVVCGGAGIPWRRQSWSPSSPYLGPASSTCARWSTRGPS